MQPIQEITTQALKLTVDSASSLTVATSLLSTLNKHLDTLTEHKEQKTKPLNQALKKIREDYRPREDQLKEAIALIRQKLTSYALNQENEAKLQEDKILADNRTTDATKINKLATLPPTVGNITTDQGSITFTTVIKYRLKKEQSLESLKQLVADNILELNTTTLKAYMKLTDGKLPAGIESYEEKSLRNFR